MIKSLRDSKISKFLLTILITGLCSTQLFAQIIPYVETMGTVPGVTQIAAHTFDLQVEGLVYSGNADVRGVLTSSGYQITNSAGTSVGNASGAANVFISNIPNKLIQINNLSTNSPDIPAGGAFLRFACIKANTYSNGVELAVEYSLDNGSNWNLLSFAPMRTGSGTNVWTYRQSLNRIPKSENVMLRFRNTSDWVQFRIDDITFDIAKKCTKPMLTASGPTEFCEGGSVTLTSTTSFANAYQWQKDGIDISGATATSYTANESGSYTLRATESDAGGRSCVITSDPTIVTKNPNPTVVVTNNGPFCDGANVTLTATPSNGSGNYSYQWKDNSGVDLAGETNSTLILNSVGAGSYTYQVLVTDVTKGCAGMITSHTFTINTIPTFTLTSNRTITSGATEICAGNTWDVSLNASGGTGPYQYTRNFNNGAQINTDGTSSYNFTNAGSYAFSVRDANNCASAVQTVALSVNSNPNVSITGANAYCQGGTAALTANPAGGTPGYTYLWSNTATSQVVNVTSGNYTVTVTDTKGCTGTSTAHTVNENANPTVSISGNGNFGGFEYCQGGNVVLTASGTTPVTYSWSNGATTAATTVTAGSYTVTVTDANNCTATASGTVVENMNPTVGIAGNGAGGSSTQFEYCDGETLTLTANAANGTAGYTYSWNSGAGSASTFDVNDASATHTVVVTDAKLCTATASQAVTQLENPTVSVTGNGTPTSLEYCESTGGITLTAIGNGGNGTYTFSWDNGLPNGPIQTLIMAGDYTVTNTDGKGCTGGTVVTVVENLNPTILISGNGGPDSEFERCVGNSIILTGNATTFGSATPVTYVWTNGQGVSGDTATFPGNSGSISGIAIRVTDSKGCIGNSSAVAITANPLPSISGFTGDGSPSPLAFCTSPGTGINVTATISGGTGGYTYFWTSGLTMVDATSNPVAVSGGNGGANALSLTVTDAKGCTASNSVDVTRNPNPTLSIAKTFVPAVASPDACLGGVEFLVNYGSQALNMQSNGVAAAGGALTYQNSFIGGSLGATDFSLPPTGATPNLFLNTPQTAPTNVSGTAQNGTTAVYGKRTVQVIVTEGNTGCTATETVDIKIVDARVNATNNLYYCQTLPIVGDQQNSAPKATVQALKTAQPNNVCIGNCTDKGQTASRGVVFTNDKSGIMTFPNPFDNQLTVGFELGQEEKVTVMITDALGRVVKTQQSVYPQGYSEHKWNTDTQAIAAGTYYIQVVSNSINYTTKVLKN